MKGFIIKHPEKEEYLDVFIIEIGYGDGTSVTYDWSNFPLLIENEQYAHDLLSRNHLKGVVIPVEINF